jgi:hypothetical protein
VDVRGPLTRDPGLRSFYTTSSCGVCGKGALEEVAVRSDPLPQGPVAERELLARLERLKSTLAAEGLFDDERKRSLPFLPRGVGLICGRASAAERDVVDNAKRRWPAVQFHKREVAVQGAAATAQVVKALKELDAQRWNESPSVVTFEAQTVIAAGKVTTTAAGPALACYPAD